MSLVIQFPQPEQDATVVQLDRRRPRGTGSAQPDPAQPAQPRPPRVEYDTPDDAA